MQSQGKPAVDDVVALMCIREMPEDQFTDLCVRLLNGGANSLAIGSLLVSERLSASLGVPLGRCEVCRDADVESASLNQLCEAETGLHVCKGCIDEALAARFGPATATTFLDREARP